MKLVTRISFSALIFAATLQISTASAQIPRFLTPVSYPVPGASMAVLADVNGDGILDIVTANGFVYNGSGVSVLLGNGDGTFKAAKTVVAGGNPSWILVGDFNGDGKADIAVANEPNPNYSAPTSVGPAFDSVSILLGNGDGTFRPSIDTPTRGAFTIAARDFNADGKLDLIVTTGDLSPVQILLGHGDGTFSVSDSAATGQGFIIPGDFNHDGKQDFLVGFSEMLGNGDGTFTTGPALAVPTGVVGDFNGDGILDMASIVTSGGRAQQAIGGEATFGHQDGSFGPDLFVGTWSSDGNLIAADFNGDGKLDLFGPGTTLIQGPFNRPIGGMFLGNGDGTFTQASAGFGYSFDGTAGVSSPAWAAAGDLDRNGSPDVIIADGTGIQVARNTFGRPPLLAQMTTNVTFPVGGVTTVTGTVSLGGPAPAGGALITLSSSNVSAFFLNGDSVTIPAGSQSATFPITTENVTVPTPVTLSASYHSVTQQALFTLVPPFTLTSVSPVALIGEFGGNTAVGTITLSGIASDGTVVKLVSANPAILAVPASVTVAPGTKTATFTITAQHVAADTSVAVTATLAGTTRIGTVTVQKELATVAVTKAEYVVNKSQLTLQATSTDIVGVGSPSIPTLLVYNANTGVFVGGLRLVGINKGVGTFTGQLVVTGSFTSVAVQSFRGGVAIAAVAQK